MSYIKRFADCCAGFALFSAVLYLFCQFMAYSPREEVSLLEKIKLFFSTEPRLAYYLYIPLIGLLAVSLAVSLMFHRFPAVCFAVSVLPMLRIIFMYASHKLYERPMLYVILAGLHMGGCLAECIRRDKESRGRRGAFACDLCGLLGVGFCCYILWLTPHLSQISPSDMNFFEKTIFYYREDADLTLFKITAILYAVLILIRLLLRDLYYLDAILALIPLGYTIYLWHGQYIPFHGSVLITLAVIYFSARLAVMLTCPPKNGIRETKEIQNVL